MKSILLLLTFLLAIGVDAADDIRTPRSVPLKDWTGNKDDERLSSRRSARREWALPKLVGAGRGRFRHDNGLVFGSRQYRAVVKDYGLTQEYITPYTPQQNGLCERFIITFKKELCWTRRFQSIEHARLAVRAWIDHYNNRRPHQSLKYLSPTQYHQTQCKLAA